MTIAQMRTLLGGAAERASASPVPPFSPEDEAFRHTLNEFADTISDGYYDRAVSTDFFWDVYRELGARGILALSTPVEYGGAGASAVQTGIAIEVVGAADFNVGFSLFGALCTNELLARFASQEVRERWLRPALAGRTAIGFAVTEPAAGSDSRNILTRARPVPGGWRLTGHKTSSGFAVVAGATIIFARTSDDPRKAITPFLVPLDSAGVSRRRIPSFGFRPTGRGEITLDDVFVPDSHVIGELGAGFGLVTASFDYTRALIALLAVGAADRAIQMGIDWISERETFGAKLATRQGVTFPIVEHLTTITASKLLGYHVLALRDAELPITRESAMSKWYATEAATNAIRDVIVLFGQRGYSEDLPLMQLMRDVQGLEIAEGATQIQKMIIAREVFGRASSSRTSF